MTTIKSNPADHVERRKVSTLIPYARNARTHSEEQVKQIAASIREWGWTTPVVVDEQGGIIAGHGRVLAAQLLGWDEVPCAVATGWTDSQKRAYVLADNKLALNAGWNEELLKLELHALTEEGLNLEIVGFSPAELSSIMFDDVLQESKSKEVNPDEMKLGCKCPKCGFEFDNE